MPHDLIGFLQQHFLLVWFLCLGWSLAFFTFRYSRHRSRGRFPSDPPESALVYSESFASGRSLKSWRTRFGGASNCLKIQLTTDRLVIRPIFPFLIIGPDVDLVHDIPLSCIEALTKNAGFLKRSLRLRFRLANGQPREVEIMSKRPSELESALERALHPSAT